FYAYAAHRDLHSFPTRRSSDLEGRELRRRDEDRAGGAQARETVEQPRRLELSLENLLVRLMEKQVVRLVLGEHVKEKRGAHVHLDRKSTRLNSSHSQISYAVFC